MGAFSDLKAQFDPVNPKRKGDQFEAVCKWFLENDSTQYRDVLRRVWLWKEWPDRWSDQEAGIDIVAEDKEGRLWAIQAKAYEGTVTRSEVNKFLTESSRSMFSYRVLMATTDDVSPIAQRTMEDLKVAFIGLTELEEFPDWPDKLSDLRPAKPPKAKKPWDYQRPAINDVVKGFKTADRGQLIMACGTGKTLTAWFIKERLAAERTLVLVPSLSLLKQTMKEWRTADPKKLFEALPVCSDDTVRQDDDEAISRVSYLGEPAVTKPDDIAAFLRRRSGPRVVFSTYQSSPQIAKAMAKARVPAFDLVIADEAHRIAAPVTARSDEEASRFTTVLDQKKIKAKRRLFMTATPRYFMGTRDTDDEIASMENNGFGEVFHRLGFGEAINRGLLTDYEVAIIGVDNATYRSWADRGVFVKLDDDGGTRTDARYLAGQIGLAKAMRKFNLRRIISFHNGIKAAKDFANSMQPVLDWMPARDRPSGSLWARHASGKMSAKARHDLLQHLKSLDEGERGLLSNARCLAEGVDVPALDGVAFIDPKRSEVDIIQAVGRAIRKSDTKTLGIIVIPVFVDTDEEPEIALNSSVFKPVWAVVKALRAHDDELGRQLDEARRELGRQRGRAKLPIKIKPLFMGKVSADFAAAFDVKLVERTTASWEEFYELMLKFREREGHCLVPQFHIEDGKGLGRWVFRERYAGRQGFLSDERRQRLDAIDGWVWAATDEEFRRGYAAALKFVEREGHAAIPGAHVEPDGFRLGAWASKRRVNHAQEKLPKERFDLLDALPGWEWNPGEERFQHNYSLVEKFYKREGHVDIDRDHVEEGVKLGHWVNNIRAFNKRGKLSAERKALFDKFPGWIWDGNEARFMRNIELLQ